MSSKIIKYRNLLEQGYTEKARGWAITVSDDHAITITLVSADGKNEETIIFENEEKSKL